MSNNTVTEKDLYDLLDRSEKVVFHSVFDKVCIVSVKLPNGFVITETSGCVDPANYNEELGEKYATERILSKLWELEGYKLQSELKEKGEL